MLALLLLLLTACSASADDVTAENPSTLPPTTVLPGTTPVTRDEPARASEDPAVTDGSRFVTGTGGRLAPRVIDVAEEPLAWIATTSVNGEPSVAAITASGTVHPVLGFVAGAGTLPAGAPPQLVAVGNRAVLVAPPSDASPLTAPMRLASGDLAWIEAGSGDLVVGDRRLAIGALPDGTLLADGTDRVLLLTEPTDRYPHGVLGDPFEASGWVIVDVRSMALVSSVRLDSDVIEGMSPMWVDLDGDGRREVIVTQSDADDGARIVVYREDGTLVASGAPVGRGNRWRHQLAVGPLGPSGEIEIATMLTPHIGGILELYRLVDGELVSVARAGTYTSHAIGSRNLDMTIAGDFDGNGRPEVVVLGQERDRVIGIERRSDGLTVQWERSVEGRITTNLAVYQTEAGIALAAGTERGAVFMWEP